MVTSSSGLFVELEAEIVELEGEIPDQATRDRLFAIPKKLFIEAQDYIRAGNAREARLTINCACKLLERAKNEFKKWNPPSARPKPELVARIEDLKWTEYRNV